jgi:predicted nucleotide-binding protein
MVARDAVVALRLKAADLCEVGGNSAEFWRRLFLVAADRLRERAKYHIAANARPLLFVGSSCVGLDVARAIQSGLKHDDVDVRLWAADGAFAPSNTPLEDLLAHADRSDFAVLVVTPDDLVSSRGKDDYVPRDNVVFELGLFLGRLGRERVYMVHEANARLKLPSDLLGITPITYVLRKHAELSDAIGAVCNALRSELATKQVVQNRVLGVGRRP